MIEHERFWSKVDLNGPIHPKIGTRCWMWTGGSSPNRIGYFYGKVKLEGKQWFAHRLSYFWAYGELPVKPNVVDHRCHNTLCVRPTHLREKTPDGNAQHRQGANRNNLSSGIRDVTWVKRYKTWQVQVTYHDKGYWGGHHSTLEAAERAAIELRAKLHTD